MNISKALRREIERSGLPVTVIAEEAGIAQPNLWRFASGKGMQIATADKLAAYFGLSLQPAAVAGAAAKKKPAKKKGAK